MTPHQDSTSNHSQSRLEEIGSNVELKMVKAWQSQAWWLWLLLPLSWIYGLIGYIKRYVYRLGVLKSYHAPVPVLIVGNITVGGSGKTPLIIQLVHFLQSHGIKIGVISRGYGGNGEIMPCMVTSNSMPRDVGDEPYLIVSETSVAMSVCPNRQLAIECLLKNTQGIQLIIADDGLQHYKLKRDIEWIVVDSSRGFGNKQLLPTGFLREPISRLKGSTVIYHHSEASSINNSFSDNPLSENSSERSGQGSDKRQHSGTHHQSKLTMHLLPGHLIPLETENDINSKAEIDFKFNDRVNFDNSDQTIKTVYAVSGIGYPQRFFNTLIELGFEVIAKPMPDHHKFVVSDILQLTDYPIIITSKDAVKIAPLVRQNTELSRLSIWVLPVTAVLSKECYTTLMAQLKLLKVV